MSRKGKRTEGLEESHPFTGMSQVNPNAAGVDIGAVEIVVCVAGGERTQVVKAFGNYTVDLQAIGRWLKEYDVKTVAMESTGVYWIPLFEELERQGFECLLTLAPGASAGVSSRSLRRVAGRKSDICNGSRLCTVMDYWKAHSGHRQNWWHCERSCDIAVNWWSIARRTSCTPRHLHPGQVCRRHCCR